MPRRPLSRRTIRRARRGRCSRPRRPPCSARGRAADVAEASRSPLPPTPAGDAARAACASCCRRSSSATARRATLDFEIHSNTFDNRYPPEPRGDVPLCRSRARRPNSPMMTRVLRRRLRARQGREPGGPRRVPATCPSSCGRSTAPRARSGACARCATSRACTRRRAPFAPGADAALAARHGRERPRLGARPRARARELRRRAGRPVDGCTQRERVARAIDAKIAAEPSSAASQLPPAPRLDRTTLAGRLGSLRIAENDLPGGLDTRIVARARAARRARPLLDDPAAARLGRRYRALGLLGGASAGDLGRADPRRLRDLRLGVPERARGARGAARGAEPARRARRARARGARGDARVVRPGTLPARRPLLGAREAAAAGRRLRAAGHAAAAVAPGVRRASSSSRTRPRCG